MSVGKMTNNDSTLNLTCQEKLKTTSDLDEFCETAQASGNDCRKNVLGTTKGCFSVRAI